MKVQVDPTCCRGHTLCAMIAPDIFDLDDVGGHASAAFDYVAAERISAVREAMQSCLEQAILVFDDEIGQH
jgi:ferredoxin